MLSPARTAGILLLLAAVATAVSVTTRLAGSAEPAAGSSVYLPVVYDTGLYFAAGATRLASGVALLATALFLRRAMLTAGWRLRTVDIAVGVLAVSGAVTAVSGGAMLAVGTAIPELPATVLIPLDHSDRIPGWLEPLNYARSITGKAGFALAGLGLIALAPAQWQMGGSILKISAIADAVIGIAMLFIWLDAATVMHRVSGIAFLLWLIITGGWLAAGLLKGPRRNPNSNPNPDLNPNPPE